MHIRDLDPADEPALAQAAQLLVDGFRDHWPRAWPTLEAAEREVATVFAEGAICRAALVDQPTDPATGQGHRVIGWIGAHPMYDGKVWELHPLVVHADHRGQGIGRALVVDLERCVAARGCLTLWLGTDDEDAMTSLGGVDLYPDPLEHLRAIRNLRGHPYEFYQKLGFVLAGVLPDANGAGKPDILMAKRVRPTGAG